MIKILSTLQYIPLNYEVLLDIDKISDDIPLSNYLNEKTGGTISGNIKLLSTLSLKNSASINSYSKYNNNEASATYIYNHYYTNDNKTLGVIAAGQDSLSTHDIYIRASRGLSEEDYSFGSGIHLQADNRDNPTTYRQLLENEPNYDELIPRNQIATRGYCYSKLSNVVTLNTTQELSASKTMLNSLLMKNGAQINNYSKYDNDQLSNVYIYSHYYTNDNKALGAIIAGQAHLSTHDVFLRAVLSGNQNSFGAGIHLQSDYRNGEDNIIYRQLLENEPDYDAVFNSSQIATRGYCKNKYLSLNGGQITGKLSVANLNSICIGNKTLSDSLSIVVDEKLANYAKINDLNNYLTLSGGKLNGDLSVTNANIILSGNFSSNGSIASGLYSFAEGCQTSANDYSHAEGYNTYAKGKYSHAEGYDTYASGFHAHAEGCNTYAKGLDSHAEGNSTSASGDYSHAEGNSTSASGDYSHAEGSFTSAFGNYSHTEGFVTYAKGDGSHVAGINANATHDWSWCWNGDANRSYSTSSDGSFCINPLSGLSGFYIGQQNLDQILKSKESNYAKINDLNNYLPLSGGQITGKLSVANLNSIYVGNQTLYDAIVDLINQQVR